MLAMEHQESTVDYAERRNLSLESLQPKDDDARLEQGSAEAQHGLTGIESRKDALDKLSHKLQEILEGTTKLASLLNGSLHWLGMVLEFLNRALPLKGFGEDIQRANDRLQQMLYATFTDGLRGLQDKIKALDQLLEAQSNLSAKIRL
uniref:Uncharacterized protein n=1 Tax=Rhodosorus marinus TaxID=101924 RepID=A0A7S2ZER8_9RHOD|mmetsp:Transcript_17056/g.69295  ORF Transcript_17056/g.69295 Transcript_17056/m.69295 type:complete len:148 (+) Transcript_17056:39-482(+)